LWWLKTKPSIGWGNLTVIGFLVVPTAALLWGIWWLWWRLPQHYVARLAIQIHDPKARADAEDNLRKTVGQALGGTAVLIGAAAAYLQFIQQQQASHDLLISNQVSKGFEQLANDNSVTMRLGGLYALEGVMNTSSDYHQPVLEALCAFVRGGTVVLTEGVKRSPATDIQTALTVIGRRKPGVGDVSLARVKIPGADLSDAKLRGANLRDADLGATNLHNADMSSADLRRANLSGADMSGADLHDAYLFSANLRGADLGGGDLGSADLGSADLHDADLRDANLRGAYLTRTDLSDVRNLTQAQLDQASCGTDAKLPPGKILKPCLY
jgi:uncharacterized protein YjbI with pentapeptide repeats